MKSTKLSFKGEKKKKRKKVNEDSQIDKDNVDISKTWTFASDTCHISGPICIIFNSEPRTCIALHRITGDIIIEPLLENDKEDIEPTSTNQIWISSKIVDSDHFSFKSPYGKYLSYDNIGKLTCNREAIGQREEWILCFRQDLGGFIIQTAFEIGKENETKYLSIKDLGNENFQIHSNSNNAGFNETFQILIQTKFLVNLNKNKKLKSNEFDLANIEKETIRKYQAGRLEYSTSDTSELKKAAKKGYINETLLDRRAKLKSDKFCK